MPDTTPSQHRSRHLQGLLAAETRHRPGEDHTDLRRKHCAAQLAEYIQKTVDTAPGLTSAQRQELARLLGAGDTSDESLPNGSAK